MALTTRCLDCRRLVQGGGLCPECLARRRGKTAERGYDHQWKRFARQVIRMSPRCARCGSTRDLTVDHIDPATRGKSRLTLNDVQVLCKPCNSRKGGTSTKGLPPGPAASRGVTRPLIG